MVARPCEFESHPAHKREETMKIVASLFLGIYTPIDTSCYSRHIYLRLSTRVSHEAYRGPRKFLNFGERKNDGNHNEQSEFLVASPF